MTEENKVEGQVDIGTFSQPLEETEPTTINIMGNQFELEGVSLPEVQPFIQQVESNVSEFQKKYEEFSKSFQTWSAENPERELVKDLTFGFAEALNPFEDIYNLYEEVEEEDYWGAGGVAGAIALDFYGGKIAEGFMQGAGMALTMIPIDNMIRGLPIDKGDKLLQIFNDFQSGKYSGDELWEKYGIFKDKDNNLFTELTDHKAKLKIDTSDTSNFNKPFNLEDVLEHEKLFELAPELKGVDVVFDTKLEGMGMYDPVTNIVHVNPKLGTIDETLGTILHENQHAIAEYNLLPQGTGTGKLVNLASDIRSETRALKVATAIRKEIENGGKTASEITKKFESDLSNEGFKEKVLSKLKQKKKSSELELDMEKARERENIIDFYNNNDFTRIQRYAENVGENTADLSPNRQKLTTDQRRKRNPKKDFRVPEDKQVLSRDENTFENIERIVRESISVEEFEALKIQHKTAKEIDFVELIEDEEVKTIEELLETPPKKMTKKEREFFREEEIKDLKAGAGVPINAPIPEESKLVELISLRDSNIISEDEFQKITGVIGKVRENGDFIGYSPSLQQNVFIKKEKFK